jgi:hypothetical protein
MNKTAGDFDGFCWPLLATAALEQHSICCGRIWSSNQSAAGAILASSSFFNQITPQKRFEISVGMFSPT